MERSSARVSTGFDFLFGFYIFCLVFMASSVVVVGLAWMAGYNVT